MLKPIYTIDQIADFLINKYWISIFGEHTGPEQPHHFSTTTITYNVDALTPQGQVFAKAALQAWSDVCNLSFVQTSSTAQITFRDDQPGAFAGFTASNGVTASTYVNVSRVEFTDSAFGGNTFNAFLHEVGHALGLGHAGPYAGTSSYSADTTGGGDNIYLNDTQSYSVMSYFGGGEFDSTNRVGSTPKIADIAAVILMYGASLNTRLGDTVYGFNSNAGVLYDFNQYALQYSNSRTGPPSLAIYDSGGSDTLNCSGYSADQNIDLTAGHFSSVGGLLNNIAIDLHTTIENAVGGSGSDSLIGNSADNLLSGGLGNDTIDGSVGFDRASYAGVIQGYTLTHNTNGSWTVSDNVGNEGTDTLLNVELLEFADQTIALPTASGATPTFILSGGQYLTSGQVIDKIANAFDLQINLGGGVITISAPTNEPVNAAGGHDSILGDGHHNQINFSVPSTTFLLSKGTSNEITLTGPNTQPTYHIDRVEFLKFTDRTIFIESSAGADIARLYSAALNRAPDIPGLSGWGDIYANNISAAVKAQGVYAALAQADDGFGTSIAGGFVQSVEFKTLYGALNDAAFVTQLYLNVLGRAPDQAGLEGWLDYLHGGGFTRDMVLVGFAESPENIAKTSEWLITI